jgi:hypothetical protein
VLILAAQAVFLVSNLAIWRDVGALTQRTCAAAAACAGAKPAQDMPRVIDGVYFLQFALKDCAGASPIPDKEQRWNADRRELECPTAR